MYDTFLPVHQANAYFYRIKKEKDNLEIRVIDFNLQVSEVHRYVKVHDNIFLYHLLSKLINHDRNIFYNITDDDFIISMSTTLITVRPKYFNFSPLQGVLKKKTKHCDETFIVQWSEFFIIHKIIFLAPVASHIQLTLNFIYL